MSAAYNDYILSTAHAQGWITPEQQATVATALTSMPHLAALDLMQEQQLLTVDQAEALRVAIAQAEAAQHTAASSDLHVAESHGGVQHINEYLIQGFQQKASDVHVGPDVPPICRINGRLVSLHEGASALTPRETERLARGFLTPLQTQTVEEVGSVDFCYEVQELGRMRCSVVRQRRGWESVFRMINSKVPSMEQLGLPEVLHNLTRYHNGLILVTGTIGCGKSTTLASMIQKINEERKDHIITLEDPIEYTFQSAGCQISQREIHIHTQSFSAALRASLREDPDVIMVGEMRDLETISLAITASETGHLVLGTLHTSNATRTLDRLLDVFPIDQQAQIRTMVSESIRGIVCQQLVPRADGKGRALALEVMTNTPAVANLIREAKTFMLPGFIQTGKKEGMKLMDDSLMELFHQGVITSDDAYQRAENKKLMAQALASK